MSECANCGKEEGMLVHCDHCNKSFCGACWDAHKVDLMREVTMRASKIRVDLINMDGEIKKVVSLLDALK